MTCDGIAVPAFAHASRAELDESFRRMNEQPAHSRRSGQVESIGQLMRKTAAMRLG